MRNFRIFDSASTYEEFTESENYVLPNVSLVMEDGSVHYQEDYTKDYLTIESLCDGIITFKIAKYVSISDFPYVAYSINGGDWISTENQNDTEVTISVSVNNGDKIRWKGNAVNVSSNNGTTSDYYSRFGSSGNNGAKFNVCGNIMSLYYEDNFEGKKVFKNSKYKGLQRLFMNSSVFSAANLILPATRVYDDGYAYMFYSCKKLVSAPDLPAKLSMSDYRCYENMFAFCSNLVHPPKISSEVFGLKLCNRMFYQCTSLETPPIMAPTQVGQYSCSHMFYGCSKLKTPPRLPAETIMNYCYEHMFYRCASLQYAPELPATYLYDSCYYGMFEECESLIIPPSLPAMTLNRACYYDMFSRCKNLKIMPHLPATSLAKSCYENMFMDCESIEYPQDVLPADTVLERAYNSMFQNCKSLKKIPKIEATRINENGCSYMFSGCISLKNIDLKFNGEIISDSFGGMFYNCESLESAKIGTFMATGNYGLSRMFEGCKNLSYIEIECTDCTGCENMLSSWVRGVSSTGTFVAGEQDAISWEIGRNGVPRGWTHNTGAIDVLDGQKIIWIDDFPEDYDGEIDIEAEIENPDSYGANAFVYQDEIEYDGETMYLWESAGNIGLGDMCDGYLVTRQNTFDGLTMEDNISNRYHPYAMLSSDMSLWYDEDALSGNYDYVFVKYEEY